MVKFFLVLLLPLILSARDWTVLVYMAADNSLAQHADLDLAEMEEIGSTNDVTVVVQVDKPTIGAQRLLVRQGSADVLQDMGVIDMCDWQTLAHFLEWGISNYPANRYFVILWDHGTGWVLSPKPSFGSDWSSGNELGISNGDLRKAIKTANNFTGERINLFAFDACLMQQIEVAYEIKDYASILLAPQNICPLNGFRYDKILEVLTANPKTSATRLARRVVEINVDNYIDIQPVAYSAVNLVNLYTLKERMDNVLKILMIYSPSQNIIDLRENVQTIPVLGNIPDPDDEYIDLGDFINGLYTIFSDSVTEKLLNTYNNTIIASDYWGEDFSRTTGLTIWFPAQYLPFKQLLSYYTNLTWTQSRWLKFLNWFYAQDDIRPTSVGITVGDVGGDNNFRIHWHKSYDLAPITYHLIEAEDTSVLFADACEDSNLWNLNGFSLNANNVHSGNHAFFSGNASNLQNSMETKDILSIENLGLLSIWLHHSTEDMTDSLIIEYGPFKDIHYGQSHGWVQRRTILPPGNYPLKISYHTNNAINLGGCYIDDIKVYDLKNGSYVKQYYPDTSVYIFNKLRGEFYYAAFAEDRYGNKGNLSNIVPVSVENYAVPYSNPNPFQTSCDIVLDYPDSLHPTVEIFSIAARRIKKFDAGAIQNKTIHWNGKDEQGREVGSGLYFILIKDGSFKRIGKIARQR